MADPIFVLHGCEPRPLVGRSVTFARAFRALTKDTPDNLSVVGPRQYGKSVFVNTLAEHLRGPNSRFAIVVLWDLQGNTPKSDQAFFEEMWKQITLKAPPELKECISLARAAPEPYQALRDFLDLLDDDKRVLMILDGLDSALISRDLSTNLWGNLRALASDTAITFVTVTRRPVKEVIRDADVEASPFFNIFNPTPVLIGVWDDEGLQEAGDSVGLSFGEGGRKEITGRTGGIPYLVLRILNRALDQGAVTLDNKAVARCADEEQDALKQFVDEVVGRLDLPSLELLQAVVEGGNISEYGGREAKVLVQLGLVCRDGKRLDIGCRLVRDSLETMRPDLGAVGRFFEKPERYFPTIRRALEHRLKHVEISDPDTLKRLEECFRDLPDGPVDCLANMRRLFDRLAARLLDRELPSKQIPEEWLGNWTLAGRDRPWMQSGAVPFPHERKERLELLTLMVDDDNSKHVTKPTVELLAAAKRFGDFGNHMGREEPSEAIAVAALNVAIELAIQVQQDLA